MGDSDVVIAISVGILIALLAAAAWFVLRRSFHTRLAVTRQIHADPNISEWFVAFDWTDKVLYLPAIVASLAAAGLVGASQRFEALRGINPLLVGGIWLAVVAANFLLEEWRFGWKTLLVIGVAAVLLGLWLPSAGWVRPTMKVLSGVEVSLNATAYLVVAALGLIAVAASWARGLFRYAAITPSHVFIRDGIGRPTEKLSSADCTIEIDKSDLAKRLLGFGRMTILFKDPARRSVTMLVGRVGAKAARLKAVRRTMDREVIVPAQSSDSPASSSEAN